MSETHSLAAAGAAPSSSSSSPELSPPAVDANASSSHSPSPTATDQIAHPSPTTRQEPAVQEILHRPIRPYSSPNLTLEEKRKETRELGVAEYSADVADYLLRPENAHLVSNLDSKAHALQIRVDVLLRNAVLAYSDEVLSKPHRMTRITKADRVRWIVEWLERPVVGGGGSSGQPRGIEQVLDSGRDAS